MSRERDDGMGDIIGKAAPPPGEGCYKKGWSQPGRAGNVLLEKRRIQGELRALPGPEGAPGELERDWGQGMEGQDTGNGEERDGWDFGKEFLARMEFPEQLWLPLDPWNVQGQAGHLGQWECPCHGWGWDGMG
ncbi:hypothetical protein TURU_000305 [Turdus rufiventris]|nr:hypothetical protein TURU_000305 [Turdus rufiventris]